MISSETESIFINLLLTIAKAERNIEILRQKIARFEDFNPYSAFQRIDRTQKNHISSKDLLFFLKLFK